MTPSLFNTKSGRSTSIADLSAALRSVGAHDCDVLFLHSGMNFGLPAIGRRELLLGLWEAIHALGVRTLCVPTFTFSFPNREVYDVEQTPSRMGTLGEFIRRLPGAIRSQDPLMSVTLLGERPELVKDIGRQSCGENSTFHKLSRTPGVKFCFLGVRAGDCFTYMHHLEWQAQVPYRYDRAFHGTVRQQGTERLAEAILNVRYRGVVPNEGSYRYEELLLQGGAMRHANFGDGFVRCVAERDATPVYLELLAREPNYFIEQRMAPSAWDKTFEANGTMVSM
jgi:aminoglycoside 3-N-acetyltransferase